MPCRESCHWCSLWEQPCLLEKLKLRSGVISCLLVLGHVLGPPQHALSWLGAWTCGCSPHRLLRGRRRGSPSSWLCSGCWRLICHGCSQLHIPVQEVAYSQALLRAFTGCHSCSVCLLAARMRVPSSTALPRIQEGVVSTKVLLQQPWLYGLRWRQSRRCWGSMERCWSRGCAMSWV